MVGEVYALQDPARTLPILDDYEADEYRREIQAVALDSGEEVQAWIYIYTASLEGKRRIHSGDYLSPE